MSTTGTKRERKLPHPAQLIRLAGSNGCSLRNGRAYRFARPLPALMSHRIARFHQIMRERSAHWAAASRLLEDFEYRIRRHIEANTEPLRITHRASTFEVALTLEAPRICKALFIDGELRAQRSARPTRISVTKITTKRTAAQAA